ncbi:MAG: fasciclin domain-containing protein [Myxococcota bacterium]
MVAVATAAGNFKTLATALEKAGLLETLKGDGPFTVFAPTDEAFAKVDKAALDALLAKPEELKKVLLMHVVKGKVMAADASKLTEAEMMSGDKLKVDASDGVKLGDAKVTKADLAASNGVIHVIDTVILPAS